MYSFRKYGKNQFDVVVVHGGPGGAGEMAPVAKELSKQHGVLEALQRADSLEGQVEELRETLETEADCPVMLVGFSWGAMLSFIVAAQNPLLVKKLVLIGTPPLKHKMFSLEPFTA